MSSSLARLVRHLALIGAVAAFSNVAAAQATAAVCKDGTTSAASGRGACSQHGGVDAAATKAAKKAARTAARNAKKAAAEARAKSSTAATEESTRRSTRASTRASARSTEPAEPAEPAPAPRESRTSSARSGRSAVGSGAKEDSDPAGAIAQCRDGLYSHATSRRGACSRHGGVKQWMKG